MGLCNILKLKANDKNSNTRFIFIIKTISYKDNKGIFLKKMANCINVRIYCSVTVGKNLTFNDRCLK